MNVVLRKLDKDMNGPSYFAVVTEQELIDYGYVWDYNVLDGAGLCVRTGYSTIKSEDEVREFLASGMNRLEWEAHILKRNTLKCAMTDCTKDVTHIDDHGFIYCTGHGEARKAYRKCRKLRPHELNRLKRGEQVTKY